MALAPLDPGVALPALPAVKPDEHVENNEGPVRVAQGVDSLLAKATDVDQHGERRVLSVDENRHDDVSTRVNMKKAGVLQIADPLPATYPAAIRYFQENIEDGEAVWGASRRVPGRGAA